ILHLNSPPSVEFVGPRSSFESWVAEAVIGMDRMRVAPGAPGLRQPMQSRYVVLMQQAAQIMRNTRHDIPFRLNQDPDELSAEQIAHDTLLDQIQTVLAWQMHIDAEMPQDATRVPESVQHRAVLTSTRLRDEFDNLAVRVGLRGGAPATGPEDTGNGESSDPAVNQRRADAAAEQQRQAEEIERRHRTALLSRGPLRHFPSYLPALWRSATESSADSDPAESSGKAKGKEPVRFEATTGTDTVAPPTVPTHMAATDTVAPPTALTDTAATDTVAPEVETTTAPRDTDDGVTSRPATIDVDQAWRALNLDAEHAEATSYLDNDIDQAAAQRERAKSRELL